ncbi:hypothetical protein KZZ52_18995 [Dactylosporangium sp. AC04546]|uniref:hypothetical protein n=1 Tax=Dactylosporangium sp. AC04546 TaxID=2862460 RepID=UPI001EDDBB5A|nr:hypothetical protein [Dactylosporangium sp. AC04546]WVK87390.1 hypothetical protein KZZ52_18995 [Dactylosporangium sp. AC04546]
MVPIDSGRFATLLHAYGRATDTPAHLAALAGADAAARTAALSHLWSAVIHQGTPWTVTPPAAEVIVALLPALDAADVRRSLLRFLAAVAEAGSAEVEPVETDLSGLDELDEDEIWGEPDLAEALYVQAVLGCRALVPAMRTAAASCLSDEHSTVRAAAAYAIGACGAGAEAAALGPRLHALAAEAGPDERATLVLAAGTLGLGARRYLGDPHPGVRACAALAPDLADDPAATAELLAALTDPAAIETWFAQQPPQFPMHIRFTLIDAALARVADPAALLPAALAVVPVAGKWTVNLDWGRFLVALAPTSALGAYLAALVERDDFWDPTNGNASLSFRQAGLPYDREACRALLGN